jgi:hypothetical protein
MLVYYELQGYAENKLEIDEIDTVVVAVVADVDVDADEIQSHKEEQSVLHE